MLTIKVFSKNHLYTHSVQSWLSQIPAICTKVSSLDNWGSRGHGGWKSQDGRERGVAQVLQAVDIWENMYDYFHENGAHHDQHNWEWCVAQVLHGVDLWGKDLVTLMVIGIMMLIMIKKIENDVLLRSFRQWIFEDNYMITVMLIWTLVADMVVCLWYSWLW